MQTILSAKASQPATLRLRLWLLLPAVVAVLVAPAWVENAGGVDTTADTSAQVSRSVQLHREEIRLQRELRELETRRQQIHMQIETILAQRQQEQMRAELQRLEQSGATEEAAELRRQLAKDAAAAELRREQLQSESAYVQKREALEFELQELSLQVDLVMARGDEAKAKELHARAEEIAKRIKALELDAMRGEIERSRKHLEQARRELEGLSKP